MATAPGIPETTYRTALVGILGLVGCGIALSATTAPEPMTTRTLLALGFGLFLAFVGLAGVLEAIRSTR